MKTLSALSTLTLFAAASAGAAIITGPSVVTIPTNHGPSGTASQSSTGFGGVPERAIDGNTDGIYGNGSVSHTNDINNPNWWMVDLGGTRNIDNIAIYNRSDCCATRLNNYQVSVLDAGMNTVWSAQDYVGSGNAGPIESYNTNQGTMGNFVRVEFIGGANNSGFGNGENFLSLAEVQVNDFGGLRNLALDGTAAQSTTGFGGVPERANDGNTNGVYGAGSTSHTNGAANDFWEVQLERGANISEIALFNRADCCGERLADFHVSIWDGGTEVWGGDFVQGGATIPNGGIFSISDDSGSAFAFGDRVRVQLNGTNFLSLAEVQVFGSVPEPSRAALLALGLGALVIRRRR